ncbi:MAG: peptidyl-tRNA hydrolase Pth2 [Nitrososphaeraceae archaeon]
MDLKQVIIIRKDLKMGTGKIAAQVAHASLLSAEKTRNKNNSWYESWFSYGQAKIILKVMSITELEEIEKKIIFMNLPYSKVIDSGRTQIDPGTTTCIGIGPCPENLVDKITAGLKLL